MNDPRDHGLGDSGKPIGVPVARPLRDVEKHVDFVACPNCGCKQVMNVSVKVVQPLLVGGIGACEYLGCPACPWAGPAVSVAVSPENPTDG